MNMFINNLLRLLKLIILILLFVLVLLIGIIPFISGFFIQFISHPYKRGKENCEKFLDFIDNNLN